MANFKKRLTATKTQPTTRRFFFALVPAHQNACKHHSIVCVHLPCTYPALFFGLGQKKIFPTNLPCTSRPTYPALFFGLGEKKNFPTNLPCTSRPTYPALFFGLGEKKNFPTNLPCTSPRELTLHFPTNLPTLHFSQRTYPALIKKTYLIFSINIIIPIYFPLLKVFTFILSNFFFFLLHIIKLILYFSFLLFFFLLLPSIV
jgi:hypothetical protein